MADKSTQERAKWEVQTLDTDIVLDMLTCTLPTSWLAQTLRDELAARGVDHRGEWVGFTKARALWRDEAPEDQVPAPDWTKAIW